MNELEKAVKAFEGARAGATMPQRSKLLKPSNNCNSSQNKGKNRIGVTRSVHQSMVWHKRLLWILRMKSQRA